jgi:hypothetical protein
VLARGLAGRGIAGMTKQEAAGGVGPRGRRGGTPRRPGRVTGAPATGYPCTVNDLVISALELLPA